MSLEIEDALRLTKPCSLYSIINSIFDILKYFKNLILIMDENSYKKGLLEGFEKGTKTVLDVIAEFNDTSMERIDKVMEDNAKGKTRFRRIATTRERQSFVMGWTVCGIQLSTLVIKKLNMIKRRFK